MQAAICAMVVWFGLFEPGSIALHKGEAVREREVVQASAGESASAIYDTKPLPIVTASYKSNEPVEGKEPAKPAIPPQNDKAASAPQQTNQKILYLTLDDGPSENTKQVLDILKQEGISATFFVLGEQVLKQPELAKRLIEEGHAIGNHTFNHKYDRLYGSFAEFAEQVMKTDQAIYDTTGVRTTLFRAPGGTYTNFDQGYFDAMAEAGYLVHDWNVDSGDSKRQGVPAAEILTTIKGSKLTNNLNVLLHDGKGHAESVKALPEIIKYYKSKGYVFAPLTEQVAPIQFKPAEKLKWSRKQVTKQERKELYQFSEKLARTSQLAHAEKNAPSLILHRGEETLALKAGEYGLKNGSIEAPLLKLSEWVGGTAEFNAEAGVLEAYYNGSQVLLLSSEAGKTFAEQPELTAVPVRETLQKFGIGIASYIYNDQQREIWLTE